MAGLSWIEARKFTIPQARELLLSEARNTSRADGRSGLVTTEAVTAAVAPMLPGKNGKANPRNVKLAKKIREGFVRLLAGKGDK